MYCNIKIPCRPSKYKTFSCSGTKLKKKFSVFSHSAWSVVCTTFIVRMWTADGFQALSFVAYINYYWYLCRRRCDAGNSDWCSVYDENHVKMEKMNVILVWLRTRICCYIYFSWKSLHSKNSELNIVHLGKHATASLGSCILENYFIIWMYLCIIISKPVHSTWV